MVDLLGPLRGVLGDVGLRLRLARQIAPYRRTISALAGARTAEQLAGSVFVIAGTEVREVSRGQLAAEAARQSNFDGGVRAELVDGLDALDAPIAPGSVRVLLTAPDGARFVDVRTHV